MEDIELFDILDDLWNVAAPESEKAKLDPEIEDPHVEDSPFNALDSSAHNRTAASDTRCTSFQYEMLTENMPVSEWIDYVPSLNEKKYSLHQFIVYRSTRMTLSHRISKPESL